MSYFDTLPQTFEAYLSIIYLVESFKDFVSFRREPRRFVLRKNVSENNKWSLEQLALYVRNVTCLTSLSMESRTFWNLYY